MNRQYRRNNISNTFKDYFVPIVGLVLILILLYSFFSGDSTDTPVENNENRTGYSLSFDGVDTEAFIEYESGKKESVENNAQIFKGEKLIVKSGNVDIPVDSTNIKVNKLGELKLNSDGSYSLFSSDVWMSSSLPLDVNLRYALVRTTGKSILSLSQNEVGSTIYVLGGTVEVSNLGGQSTLLGKGQKITVPRADASKEDIDMSLLKSELDNYFLGSDWFLENNGPAILQEADSAQNTGTGSTDSKSGLISFSGLRDEMRVDSASIDVTGIINDETVEKISINNVDASIDEQASTFILENVPLNNSINDLVIKIYNINGTILEKSVYTVYTSSAGASGNTGATPPTGTVSSSGGATYQADATQFGFTSPSSSGKFSTTGSEITIRGITTAEGISKVEVNGFELSSFNGSTWRYHAFSRFETLLLGTNQYKVDYYGDDDTVIYTDYYTIVKKEAGAAPVETVNTPTVDETETEEPISDEANPE